MMETDIRCRDYSVGSIGEYLDVIRSIDRLCSDQKLNASRHMWYRGHEYQEYTLLPSLLRTDETVLGEYSLLHLREDYRYQHFRSKCNQLVNTSPKSKIEWEEVMQHHLTNTRLMDWSESAITALLFSLEAFIDPGKDKHLLHRRATITPTVWVLDPVQLNRHIYDTFKFDIKWLKEALKEIIPFNFPDPEKNQLCNSLFGALKSYSNTFFEDSSETAINGIVCLSVLEDERHACGSRLFNLLQEHRFNPFFYLLLCYYADGISVKAGDLPPLAVVHPYHSPRIQAQHGVFTVSPHYTIEEKEIGGLSDMRAMESQPLLADCLFKVRITRPAKIARDLLIIGERHTSLYPELEKYSKDIEAKGYDL